MLAGFDQVGPLNRDRVGSPLTGFAPTPYAPIAALYFCQFIAPLGPTKAFIGVVEAFSPN